MTLEELRRLSDYQVASEAFFPSDLSGLGQEQLKAVLIQGNRNTSKFPGSLAQEFLRRNSVLAHLVNDQGDKGSKFGASATLFQASDGHKTLSFRSTEFASTDPNNIHDKGDIKADVEILLRGFAFGQIAALQIWYESLVADGILRPDEKLSITGYSLGGHLAAAFALLNPNNVSTVAFFNAIGLGQIRNADYHLRDVIEPFKKLIRDNPAATYTTPEYQGLTRAAFLGYDTVGAAYSNGRMGISPIDSIVDVYGANGASIVPSIGIRFGTRTPVFIEEQGLIRSIWPTAIEDFDFGDGHSIVLLQDSLALTAVFELLDQNFTLEALRKILEAASDKTFRSYESSLDDLRALIQQVDITDPANRTAAGEEASDFRLIELRDSYHANVIALTTAIEDQGLESTLEVQALSDFTNDQLLARAEADVAYRYALANLDAFVVTGFNYDVHNQNGELQLASVEREDGLTHKWMNVRAEFLAGVLAYNAIDGRSLGNARRRYEDVATGQAWGSQSFGEGKALFGGRTGEALAGTLRRDAIFGGRGNDSIDAGGSADYVEGGAGNDIIDAGSGDDEVHAGSGSDSVNGQAGADRLMAGSGDDRLYGGEGDDRLEGGEGFDTYVYNTGDGLDEVFDSDGAGQVIYNGRVLAGGERAGEHAYEDAAGTRYTVVAQGAAGQALVIDDALYIIGYEIGDLGIVLEGDPEPIDAPEAAPSRTYTNSDGLPTSVVRDPEGGTTLEFPLAIHLRGSNSDDLVNAQSGSFWTRGGNDVIAINAGQIYIDAGADDDLIVSASALPSMLIGGAGDDYIVGSASSETIHGDNQAATAAIGSPTSAELGGFRFSSATYGPATDDPTDRAGWALLPEYANKIATDYIESIQPETLAAMEEDVSTAGWIVGDLAGFLRYVLGVDPTFSDYIEAGAGNDTVNGGSGDDTIYGGDGDDTLTGDYAGFAINYGKLAEEFGELASMFGSPGDDYLDGGDGNDTIRDEAGGNDTLIGGAGNDLLVSVESAAFSSGTAYNYLDGGPGDDVISAGGWGDVFNVIVGGEGNDEINVWADALVDGGIGNDTYRYDMVEGAPALRIRDGGGDDALLSSAFIALTAGPPPPPTGPGLPGMPPPSPSSGTAYTRESFAAGAWESAPVAAKIATEVRRLGDDLLYATPYVEGEEIRILIEDWFKGPDFKIEHIAFDSPFAVPLSAAEFEAWGSRQRGTDEGELFSGEDNPDRITAAGGDDAVTAGAGDDLIAGGLGNDSLDGGAGDDTYFYAAGHGDDTIYDAEGFDELWFGPGIGVADVSVVNGPSVVTLHVSGGSIQIVKDALASAPAIDRVVFSDGSSIAYSDFVASAPLEGSADSEEIAGTGAADAIRGGGGNDLLQGFGGSDLYQFSLGDGIDRISDVPLQGEINTLKFGAGITSDMLTLGSGSLVVKVGTDGDEIHLDNVDPNDVFGSHDIDIFEFEDGSQLTYAELIARGFDILGNSSDEVLLGSNTIDRIAGAAGNDILYGGAGSDTYSFNLGDGSDLLIELDEPGVLDTVRFGSGIAPSLLQMSRAYDDLRIGVGAAGDELTLSGWFSTSSRAMERFEFADGTLWLAGEMESHVGAIPLPQPSPPAVAEEPSVEPPTPVQVVSVSPLLSAEVQSDPESDLLISDEAQTAALGATRASPPQDIPHTEDAEAPIDALFSNARPSPDGLLDLQIIADAVAALEAVQAKSRNDDESSPDRIKPPASRSDIRNDVAAVTAWDVARALLEFHMSRTDAGAEGAGEYVHGRIGVFGGIGLEHAQQLIGVPDFGSEAHSLRQFSGLREGFAQLS